MRTFSFDPQELRYCHVQSTNIATGDQLCYLIEEGWRIVSIHDETYLYSGRYVTLYIFTITRTKAIEYLPVVRNPFVEHLVSQFARHATRTPQIQRDADIAITQTAPAIRGKAVVTA